MSSRVLRGGSGGEEARHWPDAADPAHALESRPDDPPALRQRLSRLEASVPAMIEEARQAGRRLGEADAAARAGREIDAFHRQTAAAAEAMLAERRKMRRQMEEDLVHLAVVIARRLLHRELTVDPDALLGVVRAAIDKIEAGEVHRIRAAPGDVARLTQALRELPMPGVVRVEADASLGAGAVVLETARGIVDASVDTQLQEIDRGFTDLVRRRP